jgi:hypothetical protein
MLRRTKAQPLLGSVIQLTDKNGAHNLMISLIAVISFHRRFVRITIGVPVKSNLSRNLFAKYRSAEKCSFPALSVNATNVGGRTFACVM